LKGFTIVYGLKADTGKRVWKYSYENYDETQATPAIDEGSVYALDKKGLLCCLNSKNG